MALQPESENVKPCGPWAATLTPLTNRKVDSDRLVGHIRWLTRNGCNGVVLFGSTGEAASFTVTERMRALELVLDSGIPGSKILVGTGCCATEDSILLSKHATQLGCAGVLAIPPYFYKPVLQEGLYDAYSRIIDGVSLERLKLYLYHFPELSGVPISHGLIKRLCDKYPETVAGLKDSTGDLASSLSLVEKFPHLDVFTGDDDLLWPLLKAGGAGSITATANIAPYLLGQVWQAAQREDEQPPAAHDLVANTWHIVLRNYPVIEALKGCLAIRNADEAWLEVREPLVQMEKADVHALIGRLTESGLNLLA